MNGNSNSPFDLDAILQKLSLSEIKQPGPDRVFFSAEDSFNEPIVELGGLRIKKPFSL